MRKTILILLTCLACGVGAVMLSAPTAAGASDCDDERQAWNRAVRQRDNIAENLPRWEHQVRVYEGRYLDMVETIQTNGPILQARMLELETKLATHPEWERADDWRARIVDTAEKLMHYEREITQREATWQASIVFVDTMTAALPLLDAEVVATRAALDECEAALSTA